MSKKTKSVEGVICLTDGDLKAILNMQENINNSKILLADTYIELKSQKTRLGSSIEEIEASIERLTKDYIEEAKRVARSKGVDIDNPKEGQWRLDLIDHTLTKVS
jgi:predicted  nucleic acid-binding Zn-ribbon protein